MTRSTLTPIQIPHSQAVEGSPTHVIDVENGMDIPIDGAAPILLHVCNDGPSVATVTIQGGDPSRSPHGNGMADHVQVAPLETRFVGPIDPSTFAQSGGVIWLDFTAETVGRISAYRVDS